MGDIADLVVNCGDVRIPGVTVEAYLVCLEDVDAIPDVIAGGNPGEKLTINGDITLKALKKWAKFTLVTDSGKVMDEQVGSEGSKHFTSKFTFKIPNTGAPATEWVMDRANGCFIALVREKHNSQLRLLGGMGFPVRQTTATIDSGDESGSERISQIEWTSNTGQPALYYNGVIDLDETT